MLLSLGLRLVPGPAANGALTTLSTTSTTTTASTTPSTSLSVFSTTISTSTAVTSTSSSTSTLSTSSTTASGSTTSTASQPHTSTSTSVSHSTPPPTSQSTTRSSTTRSSETSASSTYQSSSTSKYSSSSSPAPTTSTSTRSEEPPRTTSLSTLSSVYSRTVTAADGEQSVEIPPFYTSIYASTAWDGSVITVSNIVVNPTGILSPSSDKHVSPFFQNHVAVAGVFVVAGVAVMSLVLLAFFAWRRRKLRRRRMRHYQRRRAASEQNRRPFEDDEAAHSGSGTVANSGTSASASSAELQMEMAQRPMSPNYLPRQSSLLFPGPAGIEPDRDYAYGDVEAGASMPSVSLVPHYAVQPDELYMPSRALTPEGVNVSDASLPTFDYALEPSASKFADGDNSFYSSENSVHDNVDYTRRVWNPKPSNLRMDYE